ncbi:MAG: tetratricopeptide repeat protein [Sandaracinaceae bacterium]|nr:tetratricopeptide repeat protein [Sandaracinaceae bacterium]
MGGPTTKRRSANLLLPVLGLVGVALLGGCAIHTQAEGAPRALRDHDRGQATEAARLLERAGGSDLEEAEALLRSLTRRYPDDEALMLLYAEALLTLNRPLEARSVLEREMGQSPSRSIKAQLLMARTALRVGDVHRAEAILRRAIEAHPSEIAPLLLFIEIGGDEEVALDALRQNPAAFGFAPLRFFEQALRLIFRAAQASPERIEELAPLVGALSTRLVTLHPARSKEVAVKLLPQMSRHPTLYFQLILPFEDEPEMVGLKLAAKEAIRNRQRDR